MRCDFDCTVKFYRWIWICALLQSCTANPQAEFYEINGIVSIEADQLSKYKSWTPVEYFSTASLVSSADSSGYIEPLRFPFYIENPGIYFLWILGNNGCISSDVSMVSLTFLDDQGDRLYQTLIKNNPSSLLRWINLDYDDQPITLHIHRPGQYSVNIRPLGIEGFIVQKVHLTLGNEQPPSGTGLPTTSDPRLDPLLQKRDQRVELLPFWVLGPVYGGYTQDAEMKVSEEHIQRTKIEKNELRVWDPSPDYGQREIRDLKKNIELVANPEFITYELRYASYNVGGFDYNKLSPFNEEKLIRWSQFSAFNSVMHLFSREIYDSMVQKNELSEVSYEYINELIQLRSRLFPYIYSEYYLARGTGIKPIRGSSEFPTQFMFGDSFMAAPVYEIGVNERFVNLPSGIWYDYSDGTQYTGGQSWLIDAPVYKIPLFVKAGSIIPYRVEQSSLYPAQYDSLLIEIYGGSVGTFRLYEDDGLSTQYKQGRFSTTAFRYFERDDFAMFTIGRLVREMEGQGSRKILTLIFKYIQKPESVLANEVELKQGNGISEWYYDDEEGQMILNWIQPNDIKTDIEIQF